MDKHVQWDGIDFNLDDKPPANFDNIEPEILNSAYGVIRRILQAGYPGVHLVETPHVVNGREVNNLLLNLSTAEGLAVKEILTTLPSRTKPFNAEAIFLLVSTWHIVPFKTDPQGFPFKWSCE